jgi:hypothetical protein
VSHCNTGTASGSGGQGQRCVNCNRATLRHDATSRCMGRSVLCFPTKRTCRGALALAGGTRLSHRQDLSGSEVLFSLKSSIDSSLQASSVLARGMHAGDVYLEAVWIDRRSSYVIKFCGDPGGSKLFPYQLEVRPINMDMQPGCSGPIATRPQRCFDNHAGW